MKNKKMKIGTIIALFSSFATICSCGLYTQITTKNEIAKASNESYSWDVNTKDLIYWSGDQGQIGGKVNVELYKNNGHKGIKIVDGSHAIIKDASLNETLHTEYDGDVNIETIGSRAFEGNKSIKRHINIMDQLYIDDHAFSKTNIERLVISSKTKYINEYAFADCMDLRHIVVGQATKETPIIKEGAFNNCPNLERIDVWQITEPPVDLYDEWKLVADTISQQVGHEVKLIIQF